jgi:hypothetical protein
VKPLNQGLCSDCYLPLFHLWSWSIWCLVSS